LISKEQVERKIFLLRGQKVMLDSGLAKLYGVPTKVLNQSVRRNRERFPVDFMFRLSLQEVQFLRSQIAISSLRSQSVTSKEGRGGRRYLPYAFTEQGIAMLSGVLQSRRAVQVNIAIMRAFVRVRQMLAAHRELAQKLAELERQVEGHGHPIGSIFDAVRRLMAPTPTPRRRIGSHDKGGQV